MSNVEVERKGFRHIRSTGIRRGPLALEGLTNHAQVSDPPWQQPSVMMREAINGLVCRTKREAETYLRDVIHEGWKSEKAEAKTAAVQAASPMKRRRRLQRKRSPQRLATHACRSVKAITTDAGSRTPRPLRSECRG